MDNLKIMIKKANNKDEDSMLRIIQIFEPYYKKLVRDSDCRVEEQELMLHIIHIVDCLNEERLEQFEFDGQIFNYIKIGIKNKFLQQLRRWFLIKKNEVPLEDYESLRSAEQTCDNYERVYVDDCLSPLTALQKRVIVKKVIHGASDVEISDELGVTRQSVNRIKNRALKRLRENS